MHIGIIGIYTIHWPIQALSDFITKFIICHPYYSVFAVKALS